MGCAASKARGISPESSAERQDSCGDKRRDASSAVLGAEAAPPQPAAAQQAVTASPVATSEAGACSASGNGTIVCSSGQSSWTMASSSGHRNSGGCPEKGRAGADSGAAAPAAKASSSTPVEAGRLAAEAERLAAVRLFCASPPGESCSSVST